MVGAGFLPIFIYIFKEGGPIYSQYLMGFSTIVAAFIIYKHKANIGRIIRGEELAIGAKKAKQENKNNTDLEKATKSEDIDKGVKEN